MIQPTRRHAGVPQAVADGRSMARPLALVVLTVALTALLAAGLPQAATARNQVPVQLAQGRPGMPQQQPAPWEPRQQPGDWQNNPPRNRQPVPSVIPPGNRQQIPPGSWQPPPPANWQQQPWGGWQQPPPLQPSPQFDPGPGGFANPPRAYPTPPRQYPSPLRPWPPNRRD